MAAGASSEGARPILARAHTLVAPDVLAIVAARTRVAAAGARLQGWGLALDAWLQGRGLALDARLQGRGLALDGHGDGAEREERDDREELHVEGVEARSQTA